MKISSMTVSIGLVFTCGAALIAAGQLGARSTEEWIEVLDSPQRIAGLKIAEVVSRLKLQPGQVVADLGAGTGPFCIPFAKAVGPSGKVYAVEIDKGLVDHMTQKMKAQGVGNVRVLMGKPLDPALPAADVDVAFMHDVLHHVQDRPGYLKQAARYLKPGGRFVVIDLNPGTSPHKDDPTLVVTKEHVGAWMADAGLRFGEEVALFPEKWFVIYVKK